jgi:hypothetical protein
MPTSPDAGPPDTPPAKTQGFFGAYKAAGGGGGGNCFVATAAYGSPWVREVDLLRQFRDNVLRRTRAGETWFDRFYQRYYELSPAIAERMRQDPELADALRVGIVQPYVGWLELAMTMPDGALDEVPEPWRGFLAQLIDRLDAWADAVGMPGPEHVTDLAPLDAARELAVVVRYGFRQHGRRLEYLERLRAGGALPLRLEADDVEEARRILLDAGLPREHVARIVARPSRAAP